MTIACPHCAAVNPQGGAFCESCGKALPSARGGPRVVNADALPQSAMGTRMVGDELTRKQKSASNALLAVAVLSALGAVVFGLIMNYAPRTTPAAKAQLMTVVIVTLITSGIFLGLYFWSRRAPLPASIVGLCIYTTVVVVNVALAVSQSAHRRPEDPPNFGISILDVIIIVVLARGMMAGLKYRKLLAQTESVRS